MAYAPGKSSQIGSYVSGIGPSITSNVDQYMKIKDDIANAKAWSDAANQFLTPEQRTAFGGQLDTLQTQGEANPLGQYMLSKRPMAKAIFDIASGKGTAASLLGDAAKGSAVGGAAGAAGGAGLLASL